MHLTIRVAGKFRKKPGIQEIGLAFQFFCYQFVEQGRIGLAF